MRPEQFVPKAIGMGGRGDRGIALQQHALDKVLEIVAQPAFDAITGKDLPIDIA